MRLEMLVIAIVLAISYAHVAQAAETSPPMQIAPSTPQRVAPDKLPKKARLEGSIYIPFQTYDLKKPIMGGGFLLLPPNLIVGKDKVPVMLIMHGSNGVAENHEYIYARELAKMGVAAFIVDSFTPRGIIATHDNQRLISTKDYTREAFLALAALRAEPRVDIDRAGIVGFSKGAIVAYMAAMNTIRDDMRVKQSIRFKAHYLFYPGCALHYFSNMTTGAPITMFLGEKDEYTGVAPCLTLADELKAKGADIKTFVYKDATHAWDVPVSITRPKAEVYKDCRFEQQPDGSWSEKKSGVKNMKGLYGPLYDQALKGCLRYGQTSRWNPDAFAKSMDDFKNLVKAQLLK